MDVFEAIRKRASVRRYSDKKVAKELLEKLVDAGRRAPSGRNVQPWEFIVITDQKTREKLASITSYGSFIAEAPACIAVYCRDSKYYLEDGSAAVQNILLAATGLGLGTCWVAGDKKPYVHEISKILSVPQNIKLVALIAVGYARNAVPPKAKRPLKEVLHWEKF